MEGDKKRWYDKKWLVLILFILIFPIGLYGIYKSNTISKEWKLAAFLIILISILILMITPSSVETNKPDSNKKETKTTEVKQNNQEYIPGIKPADVYLNLENKGFDITKDLKSDYQFWIAENTFSGLKFHVEIYSTDVNRVESVEAQVEPVSHSDYTLSKAIPFFKYLGSLPYDNSKPDQAGEWIENNFNNDKASTVISNVRFTILAPSDFTRLFRMEKADKN